MSGLPWPLASGFRRDATLCRCRVPEASFFSADPVVFPGFCHVDGKKIRAEKPCGAAVRAHTMDRYRLPCDCGGLLEVAAGQAGDRVRCKTCGADMLVPRLGELSRLERVPRPERTRQPWSVGQAIGLAGGCFAVLSAVAALMIGPCSQAAPTVDTTGIQAAVSAADAGTIYRGWQAMDRNGIRRPLLPEEERAGRIHRFASSMSRLMWGGVAIGAAGLAVGCWLARRSQRAAAG